MGTTLFQFPVLAETLIGWLNLLVPGVLFLAAFLHWRLTRHWSLLVLAFAPLCFVLSYISFRIGEMPLRGATLDEIASGSRRSLQPLITLGGWLAFVAIACAGIGAIGSIYTALRLGRETKSGARDGDSVPTPPAR